MVSDLRKWNQELQTNFDVSNKFMLLLFKLAEMREDEMSFAEAVQVTMSSSVTSSAKMPVTKDRLVEFLLRAGFSVKKVFHILLLLNVILLLFLFMM